MVEPQIACMSAWSLEQDILQELRDHLRERHALHAAHILARSIMSLVYTHLADCNVSSPLMAWVGV